MLQLTLPGKTTALALNRASPVIVIAGDATSNNPNPLNNASHCYYCCNQISPSPFSRLTIAIHTREEEEEDEEGDDYDHDYCDNDSDSENDESDSTSSPGRLDGPILLVFPTASYVNQSFAYPSPAPLNAAFPADAAHHRPRTTPSERDRAVLAARNHPPPPHLNLGNRNIPPPPFRNRAASNPPQKQTQSRLSLRLGPGRLWNPTNSTPRLSAPRPPPLRLRRPSTPPPPPVPITPTINISHDPDQLERAETNDNPLLNESNQESKRQSIISTRGSLQLESRASGDRRSSLPPSVRHSYDGKRPQRSPTVFEFEPGVLEAKQPDQPPKSSQGSKDSSSLGHDLAQRDRALSFGLVPPGAQAQGSSTVDKGKGKVVTMAPQEIEDSSRAFSTDLERGPDESGAQRNSTISFPDGISELSSDSSIMGDPDQPGMGEEWGPQHPCYPHLNPHVPMTSSEYTTTRIIRIRRDWLVEGDLAPTFSNLYPEILDPAGVSEQEFRRVVEKLNGELIPIFNPYNWRNLLDGVLGLVTGWIWDDLGLTHAKSKLKNLENWIEKWNAEMEKSLGTEDAVYAPKIVPLRRTGYMNLDIQIPDPEIVDAQTNSEPTGSRNGLPAEPQPALLSSNSPAVQ